MQTVTSVHNPMIRAMRALADKKGRVDQQAYLVEGGKMTGEALREARVRTLLVEDAQCARYTTLIEQALAQCARVCLAPAHVLESVCGVRTPQGIAAAIALPPPCPPDTMGDCLLVLDGVQDPGNVGTMIRTADAMGFTGVLLSEPCADPFAPKAVRATMGSILRMRVCVCPDLPKALGALCTRGMALLTGELGGEDFDATVGKIIKPLALVVGSEGQGISCAVSALATHRVALPMMGGAESLNAAVAAGIMMYGIARATRTPNVGG